ncbi:MAG: D-tyrosyl-tRNA(Tyr) deacylase [Armatimonadetes bacterium]|nr:D-tyrosyl-tRNA(Tyr) deacylase [Armatimonadota bacterium]
MRAVIQRALRASVTLKETGERREIGPGLLALVGVTHGDTLADADWLAGKLVGLRVFEDDAGKMNRSLADIPGGAMLIVSQFTLHGDARKGRRPSFTDAAPPAVAIPLYERFIAAVRARGVPVQSGEFGAAMLVEVANDGPVTLIVDMPPRS